MSKLITSVKPAVERPAGEDAGKMMSNQTGSKHEQNTSASSGKSKQMGLVFSQISQKEYFLCKTPRKQPPVSKYKRRVLKLAVCSLNLWTLKQQVQSSNFKWDFYSSDMQTR